MYKNSCFILRVIIPWLLSPRNGRKNLLSLLVGKITFFERKVPRSARVRVEPRLKFPRLVRSLVLFPKEQPTKELFQYSPVIFDTLLFDGYPDIRFSNSTGNVKEDDARNVSLRSSSRFSLSCPILMQRTCLIKQKLFDQINTIYWCNETI